MSKSAWLNVLDEMYGGQVSISGSLDEDNSEINQLSNSTGLDESRIVECLSEMHSANLITKTANGYVLSDSGFAEARARRENENQSKREKVMFLVTAVLAISSIIQSLRFIDQYTFISRIAISFVYLMLIASIGAYLNYYQVLVPDE